MSRKVAETALVNLAIQGLAALTGIVLARFLGANGRGDLATALVWPSVIGGIAVFGMDVVLARMVASGSHRLRLVYHALTAAIVFVSIPAMIVGYVLLPILLPNNKLTLLSTAHLLLLSIPASVASVLCASAALGLGAHRLFNGIRLSYSGLYLACVLVVAMVADSTIYSTAICFLVGAYCAATYGMLFLRGRMTGSTGPKIEMRKMLLSAAPFGLVVAAQSLIANLPVLLLTFLVDSRNVGYFVVAMVASGGHSALGSAIGRMLFSKMCVDDTDASAWLAAIFRQSLVLYIFLAATLAIVLPYLVPFVFGHDFLYSGVLAVGLVVSTSINSLGSLLEEALRAKGSAKPIVIAQVFGAVTLASLAISFIPSFGLKAMVGACILGSIVQCLVLLRSVAYALGITPRSLMKITKDDFRALVTRMRAMLVRR